MYHAIQSIHNVLIALDLPIKVFKVDEAWKRWKRGIIILQKEIWNQECCHSNIILQFLRVLYWCLVLITSLNYLERYYWFCVLAPNWNHSWRHQLSNLHDTKSWILLERGKISQKRIHHSSPFWKAFQISYTCFLLHNNKPYLSNDSAKGEAGRTGRGRKEGEFFGGVCQRSFQITTHLIRL